MLLFYRLIGPTIKYSLYLLICNITGINIAYLNVKICDNVKICNKSTQSGQTWSDEIHIPIT